MLGLFFVAGSEEMVARGPALLKANLTRGHWHAQSASGPRCFVGVVGISDDRTWRSPEGRYLCAVDGWMSSREAGRDHVLPDFAARVMEAGMGAVVDYRGEFTAVVIDTEVRRAVVVNDRFGKRPAYVHASNGSIQVSSDIRGLFEHRLAKPMLDRPHLVTLLRLNKVRPGTSTIFSGVRAIPPASWIEVDFSGEPTTREHVYYRHSFDHEEALSRDWDERFIAGVRSAVERAMDRAGGRVAVTLSGGLDSRLLIAATPPERRRHLVAASYGMDDSVEARVARQVGDIAGVDVLNVSIGPGDYLDLAEDGPKKNEEYDIFVQAAQALPNRHLARESDFLMSGWDLDVSLRGLYVDDDVWRLCSPGELRDLIFRKWGLFSREELERLLKRDFYNSYIESAEESVDKALAETPGATPLKRYLGFIFHYEKQRLLMLRSRFIRHELETLTPFYDEDLQAMLATVPERRRAGNRLFQKVLSRISPELHELTYQRTMLPGDVDPEFWDEGTAIELRREKLYRRIYQGTGRMVEYKRYYSNFAQWLLSDSGWRRFVDRMFVSGDALLFEEIADRRYVRELIERDRRSEASEFPKIVHLISLELYLREYFSG